MVNRQWSMANDEQMGESTVGATLAVALALVNRKGCPYNTYLCGAIFLINRCVDDKRYYLGINCYMPGMLN